MTNKSSKKSNAKAVPRNLTIVERAAAASKQLATVELQVSTYRMAALGDQLELTQAAVPVVVSLESMILDLYTRLEVLARETRRINHRIGQ
jgi:hypothetical protein